MNPYRKLLVLAINHLLENNLISFEIDKNGPGYNPNENGHVFADIAGFPSVILWQPKPDFELRISVWWKYDQTRYHNVDVDGNSKENFKQPQPVAKKTTFKNFVGVTATGYLERLTGKFLQNRDQKSILYVYTRMGEKNLLDLLITPIPKGYKAEGIEIL